MLDPEFLLTSLIVMLISGIGVIYTVSTGLSHGWRSSLAAAVGRTLGIVPYLLVSFGPLSHKKTLSQIWERVRVRADLQNLHYILVGGLLEPFGVRHIHTACA